LSFATGDRVQLDEALGTIERVRPDGATAEVLWDTGARCPLPLSWLSDPEVREAEEKARQAAERKERRKRSGDYEPRECEGCTRTFTPERKNQRFHARECGDRWRYLNRSNRAA